MLTFLPLEITWLDRDAEGDLAEVVPITVPVGAEATATGTA